MQGPHEKRLLTDLLTGYNVLERPVANESDPLLLSFGLTLQQIIDVHGIINGGKGTSPLLPKSSAVFVSMIVPYTNELAFSILDGGHFPYLVL
ncbi:hypothetical protein AVEN_234356-1 [Araneus ventricosus]|uniref:Neurotransmitter-gated ion-channel ligand-binding domain-containing protein n=1 Tax=Araneus ventricosus TaxID=182803 RepID=A0A4Y2A916_ARAVE|nr:hypothetical protein AVEN_234356-1 [Araneus ventricosus]